MLYKAKGHLLSSALRPSLRGDLRSRHWILVKLGFNDNAEYVVSCYIEGSGVWMAGHYFPTLLEGQRAFAGMVAGDLIFGERPACDLIDKLEDAEIVYSV